MKPIKDFPGYYITEDGRVFSEKQGPLRERKTTPDSYGYLQLCLMRDGKTITRKIHRLVLENFGPPRSYNAECRHLDGDQKNNHISNLTWGTAEENRLDRVRHGTERGPAGELHGLVKLTETQILEIKALLQEGKMSQVEIGAKFDVSSQHISDIYRGKRWDHVGNSSDDLYPYRPRGEKHGVSKLTEDKVRTIKQMLKQGERQRDIAKQFSVAQVTIGAINQGKTWTHVQI